MAKSKRILDTIEGPADLKGLSNEELTKLAAEIRAEIIGMASVNGGHLASSLGAVETILAVHSLIDSPNDKFIFDVGHQAYAHKLVTGRRSEFSSTRQFGGLSGFPRPDESPHDVHPSGHASDSLSVALGLAKARDMAGKRSQQKIVCLIGDASVGGGMAFEALNHIGQAQTPMVIILNDNKMSISNNVGALMKHLGAIRASGSYRTARDTMQDRLETSGRAGRTLSRMGKTAKDSVKQLFLPHTMIFEQLNIVCTTPIDGHDIATLREVIGTALESDAPVLVHVVTKKGAGYPPAEANPELFHGIGPFDVKTGVPKKSSSTAPSYTKVFGECMMREVSADKRVVAFSAAMKGGTGLSELARRRPLNFVDTGITEEHCVGMAAGLAAGGYKPVVAIYSTFLQRAIDQIIVDVALPKLDCVFCLDRAGLVGNDGPTHHGAFDLVYLRMIPNMTVFAPSDEAELAQGLRTALAVGGPFAIRYPRGAAAGVPVPEEPEVLEVGKSRVLREAEQPAVTMLSFGAMAKTALAAADILAEQGIAARVVDMRWVKPLDVQAVKEACGSTLILTLEDGAISGGAGSAVLECLNSLGNAGCVSAAPQVLTLGLPDEFVRHGKTETLMQSLGLDAESVAQKAVEALQ